MPKRHLSSYSGVNFDLVTTYQPPPCAAPGQMASQVRRVTRAVPVTPAKAGDLTSARPGYRDGMINHPVMPRTARRPTMPRTARDQKGLACDVPLWRRSSTSRVERTAMDGIPRCVMGRQPRCPTSATTRRPRAGRSDRRPMHSLASAVRGVHTGRSQREAPGGPGALARTRSLLLGSVSPPVTGQSHQNLCDSTNADKSGTHPFWSRSDHLGPNSRPGTAVPAVLVRRHLANLPVHVPRRVRATPTGSAPEPRRRGRLSSFGDTEGVYVAHSCQSTVQSLTEFPSAVGQAHLIRGGTDAAQTWHRPGRAAA